MNPDHVILKAFRDPDAVIAFSLAEWDLLIRQARQANLLARLSVLLEERGLLDLIPAQPREHLAWKGVIARRHSQAVRSEIGHIRQALKEAGVPLTFLKGAAYTLAELPPAKGRLFSDIDVMVPKADLGVVEAALLMHGWTATHHDAYDQHYYRAWMHELPPMQHIKRMTVIDVHHAILPETAPLRPDPEKLRAAAQRIGSDEDVMVFAPCDMVLHSAVHLFHDGEFDQGLRDLVDIDALLRHYGSVPSFWPDLVRRAQELQLIRPLFYALRYAVCFLHTPVPVMAMKSAETGRPNRLLLACMDVLFRRALLPNHSSCADWLTGSARMALYIRANWLRMPPCLLVRHLFHKAVLSPRPE